jgi:hypothetical protein
VRFGPLSSIRSAAVFSSTRETRVVPGIGAMSSPCASSQRELRRRASAADAGVLVDRDAVPQGEIDAHRNELHRQGRGHRRPAALSTAPTPLQREPGRELRYQARTRARLPPTRGLVAPSLARVHKETLPFCCFGLLANVVLEWWETDGAAGGASAPQNLSVRVEMVRSGAVARLVPVLFVCDPKPV